MWDHLRTRAIPEGFRGAFTNIRYARLPRLLLHSNKITSCLCAKCCKFSSKCDIQSFLWTHSVVISRRHMRCHKTISNVTELRRLQSRKHIKFTTRLQAVVVKASESVVKFLHLAGLHVLYSRDLIEAINSSVAMRLSCVFAGCSFSSALTIRRNTA